MHPHASHRSIGPTRRLKHFLRLSALGAVVAVGLAACASGSPYGARPPTNAPASGMPMAMPAGQMAQAGSATSTQGSPAVSAGAVQVGIVNFTFTPDTLTVKVGTTVEWTNHDDIPHTVSFTGSAVHSGVLARNGSYSHTFAAPGTYAYICSIHPFMHGTVIVTS
ncbi:MAG TPA: cupredoxin family copper-binding protein [Actinomycetota bacterium]